MAKALNLPSVVGGGSVGFAHQNPTTDVTVTLPNESCNMPIMKLATAVATTSGTLVDFTGIPSWAKKITVMFNGVSTNGTSIVGIQLGSNSGVENTAYSAIGIGLGTGVSAGTSTAMFIIGEVGAAANTLKGSFTLTKHSGDTWEMNGAAYRVASVSVGMSVGEKTLSGTLDRIRITTVNGTDTFDAGSVNILIEGY